MTPIDLPDLYSFELHFEDASKIFLESATGVDVYVSGSNDELKTPRIEVSFDSIEADFLNNRQEFTNHNAIFTTNIITDTFLEQPRTQHFDLVGKVRASLLRGADNWNKSNLPFYDLKFIRQQSSFRESDGDFIRTEMNFEIKFAIRDEAFPI